MNFKSSILLLVAASCYVSVESGAAGVENKNMIHPTEDDGGVWIKNQPHVLKADAGSKERNSSSDEMATSTVPPPTPISDEKGDWMVNYTSSSVCIRLVSNLKVQVGFDIRKNNATEETTEVVVPSSAKASGNCTDGTMILSWPSLHSKLNNSITFWFRLDTATHFWMAYNISGSIEVPVPTKNHKSYYYVPLYFYDNTTCLFGTHQGMSYMCMKSDGYEMPVDETPTKGISFTSANLTFSNMQLEAFKLNTPDNALFGSPNNCEMTPDMVPIAVGCALAGLVVIVLVAYLIAQRKPPSQGYRSV